MYLLKLIIGQTTSNKVIITSKIIRANLNLPYGHRTVQRVLQHSDFIRYRKRSRKPVLKAAECERRVEWARAHEDWQEEWCHILFSDEKKFNLDGPDGNSFYYHDTRKPKLLQNKRHSGGGGTMLWGVMGYDEGFTTCFVGGNMNSEVYQRVLHETLVPWANPFSDENTIFMQDNASIHRSNSTMAWLENHNIPVLQWPTRSPDMNPIENMWGELTRLVYANGKQYQNVLELQNGINSALGKIDINYINKLYKLLPRRMEAVIQAEGAITSY